MATIFGLSLDDLLATVTSQLQVNDQRVADQKNAALLAKYQAAAARVNDLKQQLVNQQKRGLTSRSDLGYVPGLSLSALKAELEKAEAELAQWAAQLPTGSVVEPGATDGTAEVPRGGGEAARLRAQLAELQMTRAQEVRDGKPADLQLEEQIALLTAQLAKLEAPVPNNATVVVPQPTNTGTPATPTAQPSKPLTPDELLLLRNEIEGLRTQLDAIGYQNDPAQPELNQQRANLWSQLASKQAQLEAALGPVVTATGTAVPVGEPEKLSSEEQAQVDAFLKTYLGDTADVSTFKEPTANQPRRTVLPAEAAEIASEATQKALTELFGADGAAQMLNTPNGMSKERLTAIAMSCAFESGGDVNATALGIERALLRQPEGVFPLLREVRATFAQGEAAGTFPKGTAKKFDELMRRLGPQAAMQAAAKLLDNNPEAGLKDVTAGLVRQFLPMLGQTGRPPLRQRQTSAAVWQVRAQQKV